MTLSANIRSRFEAKITEMEAPQVNTKLLQQLEPEKLKVFQ